ncbi:MAG: 3-methyl-2-oxobutanoate hydroxymethyltransferase, partial [Anaerolineae bacterium]
QVLVLHDLLGMFDRFTPKFVKRYANLFEDMTRAVEAYRDDVLAGGFPEREHSYGLPKEREPAASPS